MRSKSYTIPSDYIKLDTHVTDPDECVNAHDQQVFRQNHNVLVAERIRKDLCQQIASFDDESGAPTLYLWQNSPWIAKSKYKPDEEARSRFLSIPLFLTPLTNKVRFWIYAAKTRMDGGSSLASNPEIWVELRELHSARMSRFGQNTITVTAAHAVPAKYHVDINVPNVGSDYAAKFGRIPMMLEVYVECFIDNTNILHSFAPTDVGRDWFRANIGNHTFDVAYNNTGRNPPRMIVRDIAYAGDNKYFLDEPWTEVPDIGDTIRVQEILGVEVFGYGVQELAITEFHEDLQI